MNGRKVVANILPHSKWVVSMY